MKQIRFPPFLLNEVQYFSGLCSLCVRCCQVEEEGEGVTGTYCGLWAGDRRGAVTTSDLRRRLAALDAVSRLLIGQSSERREL